MRPADAPWRVAHAVTGSVNTSLPATQPTASIRPKIPLIDDTTLDLNIGDRLSDAGVSWAWYSGGWDNAAGNVTGRGYSNGAGPTCGDPESAPAGPDAAGLNAGYPYCPNKSFQQHHQPLAYFARYAPGTTGRAAHLKDEKDFLSQAADRQPAEGELHQAARRGERAPRLRQ